MSDGKPRPGGGRQVQSAAVIILRMKTYQSFKHTHILFFSSFHSWSRIHQVFWPRPMLCSKLSFSTMTQWRRQQNYHREILQPLLTLEYSRPSDR